MKGYTAKVGLRKPAWDDECDCDDCRTSDWFLAALHTPPQESWAPGWLRDQVSRSAATLDGLDPEMVKTMAHRTVVRTEDDPWPSN
jgi:hypothetical protein